MAAQESSLPVVRNLAAVGITEDTITITFAEDDYYTTEVTCHHKSKNVGTLVNPGNHGNRTFRGLEPGTLYSFTAVYVDPMDMDTRSNAVAIIQDTVPPQPAGLELSTFEVLTVEVTFFGSKVPHRIDTSGILAEWSPPSHGNCDCYQASIGPNEGLQIEPKDEGGEVSYFMMRLFFIIYSTCGFGNRTCNSKYHVNCDKKCSSSTAENSYDIDIFWFLRLSVYI